MRLLPRLISRAVRKGALTLVTPQGDVMIFQGDSPGPEVGIRITDPSLDWKIALNPELRAAEAFMDGTLEVLSGREGGTAHDLLELLFVNAHAYDLTPTQTAIYAIEQAMRRAAQFNPAWRARRNAAYHYDLGNGFYRRWLDPDLQYSCAYFHNGDERLRDAQILKKRHIAAKLRLRPGYKVLDIGCGWGGMALYLAAVTDAEVVGVTLAREQLEVARARAKAAGLDHRVRFELTDYRDVTERFDRIVSVGMLEHVGVGHLQAYFRQVHDRLTDDGVALIHSIGTKGPPATAGPFLRKYIFPGGYAPALSECAAAVEKAGLWTLDVEVWRVHYARTLHAWREAFEAQRTEIEAELSPRFARMWEFYLAACECSFRHGHSNVHQFQLGRERDVTPLHRDWIAQEAASLVRKEAEAVARIEAATREVFGEPPADISPPVPAPAYAGPRSA